jgi:hypothetical protein
VPSKSKILPSTAREEGTVRCRSLAKRAVGVTPLATCSTGGHKNRQRPATQETGGPDRWSASCYAQAALMEKVPPRTPTRRLLLDEAAVKTN